jgi:hypothetical protein
MKGENVRIRARRAAPFLLLLAAACDRSTRPSAKQLLLEIRSSSVSLEEQTIEVGATLQLTALVRDVAGTPLDSPPRASWRSTAPSVASVDSTGLVRGLQVGTAQVIAEADAYSDTVRINVADPVTSAISCAAAGAPIRLTVGQAFTTTGERAVTLCIAADTSAEYVMVPFNASDVADSRLALSFTGVDTRTPLGPPNPLRAADPAFAPQPALDESFHQRLRERSAPALEPRLHLSPSLSASPPVSARVPAVGTLLQLNVETSSDDGCGAPDYRTGRVVAVTDKAIVVADTANPRTANANETLSDQDYRFFGETFDTLVWRVDTGNFGEPTDIDNNGHVVIFFTRAVNELTRPGSSSYIGGFFYNRDLFPKTGASKCAGSNVAEMFYMMVPDPRGVVSQGNFRSRDLVRNTAVGVIAHEFQHLINDSRRIYLNKSPVWEETWLNEGLSHIAEELTFYAAAGLAPGQNVGPTEMKSARVSAAYYLYNSDNVDRFTSYLEQPERSSLMGSDVLETRGAIWSFLRYAADRLPGEDTGIWKALVNSQTQGLANLQAVLGVNPRDWMSDWAVSVYTDDAGFPVEARYQQPSWNLRALIPTVQSRLNFGAFQRYPLNTIFLSNGVRQGANLQGGGAAYLRFGVTSGRPAAIRTLAGRLPAPTRLRIALVRTK